MNIDQDMIRDLVQAVLAAAVLVLVPAIRQWVHEQARSARAQGHRALIDALERIAEQAVGATEEWARREVRGLAPHSRGEKKRAHAVHLVQRRARDAGAVISDDEADALVAAALSKTRREEDG